MNERVARNLMFEAARVLKQGAKSDDPVKVAEGLITGARMVRQAVAIFREANRRVKVSGSVTPQPVAGTTAPKPQ